MTLDDLLEILGLELENPNGPIGMDSPITKTLKVMDSSGIPKDIDCITKDKENIYLEIR